VRDTGVGSETPTGAVRFYIDGVPYGNSVSLTDGTATIEDATLSVGSHAITADFIPDGEFDASMSSSPATQVVTAIPIPTQSIVISEEPLFDRKLNNRHKPTGKAVLSGFTFDFGVPLNATAAANAANYQLDTVTTKKGQK
jgi:Bacterial Ig-like domain (group 3)